MPNSQPSPLQPSKINGKKVPLGQRKLTCDDVCAKTEKKKVLSDAFGVTPHNFETLHFGENAAISEVFKNISISIKPRETHKDITPPPNSTQRVSSMKKVVQVHIS